MSSGGYVPDNYEIWEAHERDMERRRERDIEECGVGRCVHCDEFVLDYEEHYNIHGDLVCGECVLEWLQQFKG